VNKNSNSLGRFVDAQDGTHQKALSEIRQGRKQSHWMWFIFPQVQGLGLSSTSQFYGLRGLAEATAYLDHEVLGGRLREISQALLDLPGSDAVAVFGGIDSLKLKSSMTIFALADKNEAGLFQQVLDKFYQGQKDGQTLKILGFS
jgi:uncharacterized protein (DUF1810 family)